MSERTTTATAEPVETTPGAQPRPAQGPPRKGEGTGFARMLHDLRHRRQRYRQFVGVLLVFVFTLIGKPTPVLYAWGASILVLGMLIRFWASGYVMKNEVLATVGPYGRVRHPLYVGNLAIAVGICLASGLWWSFAVMAAMVWYFYPHTIRYEDTKLRRLFPDLWDRWAARTRALIPSLVPYPSEQATEQPRWSFRLSLLRNGEPLHIAIGLLCLAFLWNRLP